MAFEVKTYQFNKKVNSTKRPANGTELATYDATVLKDQCSILAPTIKLNIGTTTATIPNYVYIPIWDRYYFVTDIRWERGIWTLSLKVDALASWKTSIGAQSLYVTRAASQYDGKVMDNLYPAKSQPTYTNIIMDSAWNTTDLTTGTFVVGIAGQSTTYYKFGYDALQLFLQYILGPLYADDLVGLWATVYSELQWQANPLQYIVSINWFPFIATPLTGTSTVRVGYVDVPTVCSEVSGSGLVFFSHTVTPPEHPQAASRGEFLNGAPYSSYDLFYPPFGQIDLDATLLANSNSIDLLVGVDLRTGKGTLSVLDNTNTVITSWLHSQVSIPYQTTQIGTQGTFDISKALGMAGSMIPAMASANVSGMASGLISGGVSAVGDYARGKVPSARTLGSNGGMNSLRGSVTLQCEFKLLVDESNQDRGRPLCKVRTINTLSGYIMVSDADIEIAAMEAEQQEIRNYMEGGFFYE
jgi:hypothetical protein